MNQTFAADVLVLPEDEFYLGKISITIAMFGLLVDSLGLAAVYIQYKVKHGLLVPMLAFYAVLVPTAAAGLCVLALGARGEEEDAKQDYEERVTDQVMMAAFPIMTAFYAWLWVHVLRLYRFRRQYGNAVMGVLTQTFLEPLTAKANQDPKVSLA